MGRIKNNLEQLLFYLIIFFPIIFFFRSFILNFTVILISLIFIFVSINENYKFWKFQYNKVLLFFFIYFFLSQFFFNFELDKLLKSMFLIKFFFLFNATIYVFSKINIDFLRKKIKYLIYLLFFFILDLFLQYFTGTNVFGFEGSYCGYEYLLPQKECLRYSGIFGSELVAGGYISIVVMSVFILILLLFDKFYLNLIPLLLLIAVFFSGERTALILTLIFNIIYFIFVFKFNLKKFLLSVLVIFLFIFFVKDNSIIRHSVDTLGLLKNEDNLSLVDSLKTTPWGLHYTASILMIKEKPLFGNGYKSFRVNCHNYEFLNIRTQRRHAVCSSHPHNFHLEVMVDSGILGYLILLASVYFFLKRYFQYEELKKNKLLLMMFLYLITFIFFPRPTGSIFSTFFGSMFWYFIGSVLGYTNLKK